MASQLRKSTSVARKVLIGFLLFAIISFLWRFIIPGTDPIIPIGPTTVPLTPYLRPDSALGTISLPEVTIVPVSSKSNIAYSIDERGQLPDFPPVINVYRINRPREVLGNSAKALEVARNLGFTKDQGEIISDSEIYFVSDDKVKSLTYDKVVETWKYVVDTSREFLTPEETLEIQITGSPSDYQDVGILMLTQMGLITDYYKNANSRVDFINLVTDHETLATSNLHTDYVRIAQYKSLESSTVNEDYRPASGSEDKAVTTFSDVRKNDFLNGVALFHIRGKGTNISLDQILFDYREFDYGDRGVYKALDIDNAWLKVQAGEGNLIWILPLGKDPYTFSEELTVTQLNIKADKTQLIYLEPVEWDSELDWTQFTQPYYLFQGEAEFANGSSGDFALILEALDPSSYSQ